MTLSEKGKKYLNINFSTKYPIIVDDHFIDWLVFCNYSETFLDLDFECINEQIFVLDFRKP